MNKNIRCVTAIPLELTIEITNYCPLRDANNSDTHRETII